MLERYRNPGEHGVLRNGRLAHAAITVKRVVAMGMEGYGVDAQ
jgi:hypothetical protein